MGGWTASVGGVPSYFATVYPGLNGLLGVFSHYEAIGSNVVSTVRIRGWWRHRASIKLGHDRTRENVNIIDLGKISNTLSLVLVTTRAVGIENGLDVFIERDGIRRQRCTRVYLRAASVFGFRS